MLSFYEVGCFIAVFVMITVIILMCIFSAMKQSTKKLGIIFTINLIFIAVCFAGLASNTNANETTDTVEISTEEDTTEVTYEMELVLMEIAEDMAKRIAQNPSTVDFAVLEWGFARDGTTFAVQGGFSCSNLLGVSEKHTIRVWCEASDDYSKIQPYRIDLDGSTIVNNSTN